MMVIESSSLFSVQTSSTYYMESFISFFEQLTSLQKLAVVFACLGFNWILEMVIPLFKFSYNKWNHAKVNLFFLATTLIINTLFTLMTVGIFQWMEIHQWGLLNMIYFPDWVEIIIALLLLDFIAQYMAHYTLHRVKWMWKMHLVHHSDTHVDVTTGTRHHPGDYVVREVFALLAILIGGIPLAYYIIYRILSIVFTYYEHANVSFPKWLDRTLGVLFITPDMHKFHHHFERPWTDSNFGNIFSLWDRLFGTLVQDDTRKIHFGIDVLEDKYDEDILYQLKVPFDGSIKTDY